jgi:hypothetical protein
MILSARRKRIQYHPINFRLHKRIDRPFVSPAIMAERNEAVSCKCRWFVQIATMSAVQSRFARAGNYDVRDD